MTNSVVLLIAIIVVVSVMIIALIPRTKRCKFNIEFSLQNGFKITFQTDDTAETDETNANPTKEKR